MTTFLINKGINLLVNNATQESCQSFYKRSGKISYVKSSQDELTVITLNVDYRPHKYHAIYTGISSAYEEFVFIFSSNLAHDLVCITRILFLPADRERPKSWICLVFVDDWKHKQGVLILCLDAFFRA